MPSTCCVQYCSHKATFRFPVEERHWAKWAESLGMPNNFVPEDYHRICDRHFRPQDILSVPLAQSERTRRTIRMGAVPLPEPWEERTPSPELPELITERVKDKGGVKPKQTPVEQVFVKSEGQDSNSEQQAGLSSVQSTKQDATSGADGNSVYLNLSNENTCLHCVNFKSQDTRQMARHIAHTHLMDLGQFRCNLHPNLKFFNTQGVLDHFVSCHLDQLEIKAKFLTGNIINTFLPIMGNTKIGFTGLRMAFARENKCLLCPKEVSSAIGDPLKLAKHVVKDILELVKEWKNACKFCGIQADSESELKNHFLKSHLAHLNYEANKSKDVSVLLQEDLEKKVEAGSNNEVEKSSNHESDADEAMDYEDQDDDIGIGENDFTDTNATKSSQQQEGSDPLSVKETNQKSLGTPPSNQSETITINPSLLKTMVLSNETLKMLGGKLPDIIQTKDKKRFKIIKVLSKTNKRHVLQVQSIPYAIPVLASQQSLVQMKSQTATVTTNEKTIACKTSTVSTSTIIGQATPVEQNFLDEQALAISDPDQFLNRVKVMSCCVYGCPNQMKQATDELRFHALPKDKERLSHWIRAMNSVIPQKLMRPKYSTFGLVCSEHFLGGRKSDRKSSSSYIPTIFKMKDVETENNLRHRITILEKNLKKARDTNPKLELGKGRHSRKQIKKLLKHKSVQRELLALQNKRNVEAAATSGQQQQPSPPIAAAAETTVSTSESDQHQQPSPSISASFHDYLAMREGESLSLEAVEEVMVKQEPIQDNDANVESVPGEVLCTESVKLECDVDVAEATDQSENTGT